MWGEEGTKQIEAEIKRKRQTENLQNEAARVFTGELNNYIENARKAHEQKIDLSRNPDEVIHVGWDKDNLSNAKYLIASFVEWMQLNKNELVALQIFYNQPYRRRGINLPND